MMVLASAHEQPGLHHVVQDLREQLRAYDAASPDAKREFQFSVLRDEARKAIEHFHRTSCAAEKLLVRAVDAIFAPDLEKILVTVGACPTLKAVYDREKEFGVAPKDRLHWHIRKSHVIGKSVPQSAYEDALNTPDQRLSDVFPPLCPYERGAVEHPAVLSYLRHIPADLMDFRMHLDDLDGEIQGMRYSIARRRLEGATDTDKILRQLYKAIDRQLADKAWTQDALTELAMEIPHDFLQVKTRVKGIGRLAEKIVRMALNVNVMLHDLYGHEWLVQDLENISLLALNVNGTGFLRDHYGIQCVANTTTLDETLAYASGVQELLLARDPNSVIEPVASERSASGVWEGSKMYATFSDDGVTIPIAFQFLPAATYWRQNEDHPYYEEKQRQALDNLRSLGKPVDAMLAAVTTALEHAAAQWRAAHSSA